MKTTLFLVALAMTWLCIYMRHENQDLKQELAKVLHTAVVDNTECAYAVAELDKAFHLMEDAYKICESSTQRSRRGI